MSDDITVRIDCIHAGSALQLKKEIKKDFPALRVTRTDSALYVRVPLEQADSVKKTATRHWAKIDAVEAEID